MVIPSDRAIQAELLKYLSGCLGYRAHAQKCYAELETLFPELTREEVTERYQASVSKWANSVQFARLHLVNQGLIYRAGDGPSPSRGVWILTPAGVSASGGAAPTRMTARVPASRPLEDGAGEGIILGWNRARWDGWEETYDGAVNIAMSGAPYEIRWSVGSRVDVPAGTHAWLLRQGGPYGLLGHGIVTSEPFEDDDFAKPGQTSRYVQVAFDVLLDENDILSRDILEYAIPEFAWRYQLQSGNRVDSGTNDRLLELWNEHIS
ncbi:winged helix-turn-helix domain-containing protein [Microbacterium azadirachtae]|uniref:winged helix-turn-helix domain-containing protein n=1 Tax=Microbacterium azadirachtae TaxID=582680 RepID=UPI0021D51882|nr:winged helix-turn-helix domain-containing protein [Microbacterium azadirachtae]UXW85684.1 winged helix-turn-helix domain-containing protein [Microbacterium azadirachtae]